MKIVTSVAVSNDDIKDDDFDVAPVKKDGDDAKTRHPIYKDLKIHFKLVLSPVLRLS